MTVIVTVNVEGRYRGFLASAMLEIAPGVYTSPNMTSGIRDRIWDVLAGWYYELGQGSIVMTWRDPGAVSEQEIRSLGESPNRGCRWCVPKEGDSNGNSRGRSIVGPRAGQPRTRGDTTVVTAISIIIMERSAPHSMVIWSRYSPAMIGSPALAGIDRP